MTNRGRVTRLLHVVSLVAHVQRPPVYKNTRALDTADGLPRRRVLEKRLSKNILTVITLNAYVITMNAQSCIARRFLFYTFPVVIVISY